MLTRLLCILGCMLVIGTASAELPDFTASYKVLRGALGIGTARIALTRETGGGYHYTSHSWPSRLAGLFNKDRRHETSSGQIIGGRPRPDKYHYLRAGGDHERVAHLTFDWDGMRVVNNVAGSRWRMSIPAGTQDKLSTRLGMMQALAAGKTDFSFDVADGGKLKQFHYQVLGRENLELPAGTFESVKVAELRGKVLHRTWVWCAPALNFLPVQILREDQDGTRYSSQLKTHSDSLKVRNR